MIDRLLTRKEAAQSLHISVDTLDRLSILGRIRPLKIGARVYYAPKEIDRFVEWLMKEGWTHC